MFVSCRTTWVTEKHRKQGELIACIDTITGRMDSLEQALATFEVLTGITLQGETLSEKLAEVEAYAEQHFMN